MVSVLATENAIYTDNHGIHNPLHNTITSLILSQFFYFLSMRHYINLVVITRLSEYRQCINGLNYTFVAQCLFV